MSGSVFTRRYGASPLHLLGASRRVRDLRLRARPDHRWRHGRQLRRVVRRRGAAARSRVPAAVLGARPRRARMGAPRARAAPRGLRHPDVPVINHIRAPALISGLLLLVYFPLILGAAPDEYLRATGHHLHGYARNWLLISRRVVRRLGAAVRDPRPRAEPARMSWPSLRGAGLRGARVRALAGRADRAAGCRTPAWSRSPRPSSPGSGSRPAAGDLGTPLPPFLMDLAAGAPPTRARVGDGARRRRARDAGARGSGALARRRSPPACTGSRSPSGCRSTSRAPATGGWWTVFATGRHGSFEGGFEYLPPLPLLSRGTGYYLSHFARCSRT